MNKLADKELEFLDGIQSGMKSDLMDRIMVFVTRLGDWGIIWVLICLFMFIVPQYRDNSYTLALAILLNALLCNVILKPLFHRKRPFDIKKVKLLVNPPTDFSFPSGHTTASFAAATVIFSISKTAGIIVIILALLIGFSRMYLYVHFPSDVLVGGILGISVAIIAIMIMDISVIQELKLVCENWLFGLFK